MRGLENIVAEGADDLKIFFQIIDELERMRVELLYSVGNAVIARTETLQCISDISSHCSHQGQTRLTAWKS